MKFKRITKRTKLIFPCVVAYRESSTTPGWAGWVASNELDVTKYCTHWMPFQWPEVRGE